MRRYPRRGNHGPGVSFALAAASPGSQPRRVLRYIRGRDAFQKRALHRLLRASTGAHHQHIAGRGHEIDVVFLAKRHADELGLQHASNGTAISERKPLQNRGFSIRQG